MLREINHNFKCHSTSMDISSISNDIIYKINQSLPLICSFIENREWKNKSSLFLKENQVKEVKCFFLFALLIHGVRRTSTGDFPNLNLEANKEEFIKNRGDQTRQNKGQVLTSAKLIYLTFFV